MRLPTAKFELVGFVDLYLIVNVVSDGTIPILSFFVNLEGSKVVLVTYVLPKTSIATSAGSATTLVSPDFPLPNCKVTEFLLRFTTNFRDAKNGFNIEGTLSFL